MSIFMPHLADIVASLKILKLTFSIVVNKAYTIYAISIKPESLSVYRVQVKAFYSDVLRPLCGIQEKKHFYTKVINKLTLFEPGGRGGGQIPPLSCFVMDNFSVKSHRSFKLCSF